MTMTSARGFLVALSKTVPVKAPVPCWASTAPAPTIDAAIPTAMQASQRRPLNPALVIACRPIFRQRLLSDGPREHCLGCISRAWKERVPLGTGPLFLSLPAAYNTGAAELSFQKVRDLPGMLQLPRPSRN